ncbi:TetR/AcrR family transcriptional regulator [Paraneptunicella aestuarii]|uniref:TetR/AcrR family transcriptional regulator n=1 Tax=Paraneptunicella aestuarii TaxID=2831148 RepID=UPI001E5566A4|nr:TetR/AcrR family transcriptional regulator [Paraneptunicella aestuarii]UAA38645.1 TetR/AcrR family transcriptional regulator [Paraneptunicella aestuarii]
MFKIVKNLDARAKRSRDALLKAGLQLLNSNKEASLSDIANHAGVGRATLYRQFETREQLIKGIAIHCFNAIDTACLPINRKAKSGIDAIRLTFEYVIPLTQELQFLMKLDTLTEDDPEVLAIYRKQKQETVELVEYCKKEGSISNDFPTVWVTNLIEGLFFSAALTMEESMGDGHKVFTAKELAELSFKSFCRGVGGD